MSDEKTKHGGECHDSQHYCSVEWQGASVVIVNSLEGGDCEQKGGLADQHASQPLSDCSTTWTEDEALNRTVLQCTK